MQIEKKYGHGLVNLPVRFVLPLVLSFVGLLPGSAASARQATTPDDGRAPAKQESKQSAAPVLATISQSGSTNSRGYKVVIYNDGSATAEIAGAGPASRGEPSRAQQFPPGTVDTATLRRLLEEVGDVSKIPAGNCPKSVSFGTRTQITYAGNTSGDLQCIREQPGQADRAPLQPSEGLGRFVQTTLAQLKINTRRVYSIQQP